MSHSHEEIEMRAYEAWEERGRPWGSPEADWFKAERELASTDDESIFSRMAREVGSAIDSAKALLSDLVPEKHDES